MSRILNSLLLKDNKNLRFRDYANDLKLAYKKFFDHSKNETKPDKKMMKFVENAFNLFANKFDKKKFTFRDPGFWNLFVNKYFLKSPQLIKENSTVIFDNLRLTLPKQKLV